MMFPISYLDCSVNYFVCLLITLVYSENYHVCLLITKRTNQSGKYNHSRQGFMASPLGCLRWFMDHKSLSTVVYLHNKCKCVHNKCLYMWLGI